MKVIAFNSSPRKNGNTAFLLQKVFQELEKENITTELVSLANQKIRGCVGCMQCFVKKDRHCALQDEDSTFINECINKMLTADGIIFASPTYVGGVSADMKAFIERVTLVTFANRGMLKHKVGAAVTTTRRTGALHTLQAMNTPFTSFEMFVVGSHFPASGIGLEPGTVEQDAEALESMKTLGQNMAFLLKKLNQ
jgi:multimeric flavodoxin WrbA